MPIDTWSTLLQSPTVVEAPAEPLPVAEEKPPEKVEVISVPLPLLKGRPVRVFSNESVNKISDTKVDCRNFNRVHFDVVVTGTTPSATITILGLLGGRPFVALSDSNATQAGVTANDSFDCIVGCEEITVEISSISGTFGAQQGFTVVVTPYIG